MQTLHTSFADDATLSAEDATDTISVASTAFCLEDTAATSYTGSSDSLSRASTGLTKAELLAQSVPFDAPKAVVIVNVGHCDLRNVPLWKW